MKSAFFFRAVAKGYRQRLRCVLRLHPWQTHTDWFGVRFRVCPDCGVKDAWLKGRWLRVPTPRHRSEAATLVRPGRLP